MNRKGKRLSETKCKLANGGHSVVLLSGFVFCLFCFVLFFWLLLLVFLFLDGAFN